MLRTAQTASIGSFLLAAATFLLNDKIRKLLAEIDMTTGLFVLFWLLGVGFSLFVMYRASHPARPRKVIADKSFADTTVFLDGRDYQNCIFTDVTFRYKGRGYFKFDDRCIFNGVSTIAITGNQFDAVLKLLQRINLMPSQGWKRFEDDD